MNRISARRANIAEAEGHPAGQTSQKLREATRLVLQEPKQPLFLQSGPPKTDDFARQIIDYKLVNISKSVEVNRFFPVYFHVFLHVLYGLIY